MENLLQKEDERGFTVLPLLCGVAVIGWLSGCVYLLGNNERRLVNHIKNKMEIQSFCEQSLMNTARRIENKEIPAEKIKKTGNDPIYTGKENGVSCNVYVSKENESMILLGEGKKDEGIVRIYLHLIWQEDSEKWVPLYYEN